MITIPAGQMMGTTMVAAVEDDMAERDGRAGALRHGRGDGGRGQVKFYLWDAAVPPLPIIARFLLAAFLAIGGYRRYLRR